MYHITIGTWDNGTPVTVRRIDGFLTKEDGMTALRNIGHSWQYNIDYVGRLKRYDGKEVGRLNIFKNTYRVDDLELIAV